MNRALWQNDETPIRFYTQPENKYRYLKFFLSKRLELLADECGYEGVLPELNFSNETTHTLTFIYDDAPAVTMEVPDGALLTSGELPPCSEDSPDGWLYKREERPFSPFIPIYEDMSFIE